MKIKLKRLIHLCSVCLLAFSFACQDDEGEKVKDNAVTNLTTRTTSYQESAADADDATGMDFKNLSVTYDINTITIDMEFYDAVTLSWGEPYIRFYDNGTTDRYLLLFPETGVNRYIIKCDKNDDGYYETEAYGANTVTSYNSGAGYIITIPRGVIPDIGEKEIWGYSMTSHDRIPDTGNNIEFTSITSTEESDSNESYTNYDFSNLETGYDAISQYLEVEFHNSVTALQWGDPYVYFRNSSVTGENYLIIFTSNTNYTVKQDSNDDGYYETTVYSGTTGTRLDAGKRFTIIMPAGTIPTMSDKSIWGYSMTDTDRIPDSGYITF